MKPSVTSFSDFDFFAVVRVLRQRGLRHHVLPVVRGREGPQEEQEEAQARATSDEPPQQRSRSQGNFLEDLFFCRYIFKSGKRTCPYFQSLPGGKQS